MKEGVSGKRFDLEERTFRFSKQILGIVQLAPKTFPNVEICKQLIRSAGSVGANYIEANESVSKKDFLLRIKISKKEAKESRYWLQLLEVNPTASELQKKLIQESTELMKIFGAIIEKSK